MVALVKALKSVDLPTFGNPTIPHLKPMNAAPEKSCKHTGKQ
jgi:hypothetical protein